jgi:uncharacterized protein
MRSIYDMEPARGWIPWGLFAPVLCFIFILATTLGVSFALRDFGLFDAALEPVGLNGLLAMLVIDFGAGGLLVILWVVLVEQRSLSTIGLKPAAASSFLSGYVIGGATIAGVVGAIWVWGAYEAGAALKAFAAEGALARIGLLALGFIVQASVEEIMFRGWLLSAITRKLGLVVAVLLSSMLFSALHYGPGQLPLVTANTFVFALFACAWAIRTQNIWGVMGWHAGWNWLLAVGFELPVTGIDVHMPALIVALHPQGIGDVTGGAQGPEGSIFCTIFFVAAAIGLFASTGRRAS